MRKLALLAAAALFLAPPVLAQTQQYTGKELETALRDRSIPTLGPTVVAMVKDLKPGNIAVAFGSCDTAKWVELPTAAIAGAQLVGTVPCRDQRHPLVRIRLAPVKDETARPIAELLSKYSEECPTWHPWYPDCSDPPDYLSPHGSNDPVYMTRPPWRR